MDNSAEKILIRGVNWIGDAVMTLPSIRSIRAAFRDSKMYQLLRPSVSPLFEKDPNIDEIMIYENKFRTIAGRITLSSLLRKEGFSKAYLLQNAFDAALLVFLAGIPERIGYSRDGRGFLLTKPIPFKHDDRRIHHIDYYLNILKKAGIKAEYSIPYIFQSLDERLEARKLLSNLQKPILGINPGAAYGSAKRWLPERFAEVADWFIKDMNGSIVIFGGENEKDISNDILLLIHKKFDGIKESDLNSRFMNFTGKTSLRQLISLISECNALVTNDSGPMHIAYAVGTPVAAIFGSTSPELTGPPQNGNIVIRGEAACSPCFRRKCNLDYIKCMYSITSDEVCNGIKKIMPRNRAVFFDRDGTLCKDADHLKRWDDFSVFPDIHVIERLKSNGFYLIGISNQSGVARGMINESFVQEVNRLFIDKYHLDDFFYCPHHPDEHCSCRKPEMGLMHQARAIYMIDLKGSFVIGDTDVDMLLAKAAGAKGILVRTGKQKDSVYADYSVNNLSDAVNCILKNYNRSI